MSEKAEEEKIGVDSNSDHSKMVAHHYNSIEEKGLAERFKSKIFFMRNFNNFIKSILINEYLQKIKDTNVYGSPLRVLDIGCGKGGDLLKWQKGNITYLICTDIADVSLEQCKARYDKTPPERKSFKAEFFVCDSTRDRLREKYRDPAIDFQLVSCQFAFHYCFESLKQAQCMLRNASECLKAGGYFIGTIPDANEIMKRQKACGSDTFGNDIYEIKFLSDPNDLPIFGAKYNFNLDGVVDCPEFLVHFPSFVELAKRYNLKLVAKERFEDYYDQKHQGAKNLIEKMQALEYYDLSNSKPRENDDTEYLHAKEYLLRRQDEGQRKRYATMSKSEWEAVTLYTVFAFQKVKGPIE